MSKKLTIDEVNKLSAIEFQQVFENVIESWPEAAKNVSQSLPITNLQDLLDKFVNYLTALNDDAKTAILCLHPDLAGRLSDENRLTAESANEQASAGLDKLSTLQKHQLLARNAEYLKKFGFPFVICVRENNKIEHILDGFEQRINNETNIELNAAINEVKKICTIRIQDIVG